LLDQRLYSSKSERLGSVRVYLWAMHGITASGIRVTGSTVGAQSDDIGEKGSSCGIS
jgi:hypothetical protein